MIVYGDRIETVRRRERIAAIADAAAGIAALPPGIARHEAIAAAFVALGQVVQAVADADRERLGADGGSAAEAALLAPSGDLARALLTSWSAMIGDAAGSCEAGDAVETRVAAAAARLRAMSAGTDEADGADAEIALRLPEGYAFYAVYPEAYAAAARRLRLAGSPCVIGIRSIGAGLAALVAAVLGAPAPLTVRPIGHPFDRRIALTPAAEAALIDPARHYVVVDEGPGLSGSSFAAVAAFLADRGVAAARIAFLPSHAGAPGSQASPRTRARWAQAQRPVVAMDELIPPARLAEWLAGLVGPVAAIEDVSGGGWRRRLFADERDWPAVHPGQERRKFLIRAGGGDWLVKFAGIGAETPRKLARGRLLHAAGLAPEVRGSVHGFLVQRWIEAAPVRRDAADAPDFAGAYLGARARLLPAPGGGASLAELFAMARHNIGEALGDPAAAAFARHADDAARLAPRVRRIATDNRCDSHEWLRPAEGRVLKADALDHDAAHDLIGAQDLAWDVAGVAAEFALSAAARGRLIAVTEQAAGRRIDRELLGFLTPCYLAFRLGAAQLAADSLGGWPAEAARNRAEVRRYAARLETLLGRRDPLNPPAGRSQAATTPS